MTWKEEEVLVIVKVYPSPSIKYGEVVCTAGITNEGKFIRLYPIPYRDLPDEQQFKKFLILFIINFHARIPAVRGMI